MILWAIWILAASMLSLATMYFENCAWSAGLLLGGSFSHALETSIRGEVMDYVCLRFGPAFNLADAAILAGTIGIALALGARIFSPAMPVMTL